jgi:serine/threonine protein phosphatase PrpC
MTQEDSEIRWRVLGASATGAAKRSRGKENQDRILWVPESGTGGHVIMAVSDGHGQELSFRSARGSRFAVEIAIEELTPLLPRLDSLSPSAQEELSRIKLPQKLVSRWGERVFADLDKFPFSELELRNLESAAGRAALVELQERPAVAYGATLIIAAIASSTALYLQIGDGDLVTVQDNGQVNRPVPGDPRLQGNTTTSLCGARAAEDFRAAIDRFGGDPLELVLLATDGYFNSFRSTEGFEKASVDLLETLRREAPEEVQKRLTAWLDGISRGGSGDDVTLGLIKRSRETDVSRLREHIAEIHSELSFLRERLGESGPSRRREIDYTLQNAVPRRIIRLEWLAAVALLLATGAICGLAALYRSLGGK